MTPGDFFDASGFPVAFDTIANPRIRIGGAMDVFDINNRVSSGTDPLPASDLTVLFEQTGEVTFWARRAGPSR